VCIREIGCSHREECRLRDFKNSVLRRIFVPKKGEITGAWRILQKEELYYSPTIIQMIQTKRNEVGRSCGTFGKQERCIRGFGGEN
jgi:hypothetical protein